MTHVHQGVFAVTLPGRGAGYRLAARRMTHGLMAREEVRDDPYRACPRSARSTCT